MGFFSKLFGKKQNKKNKQSLNIEFFEKIVDVIVVSESIQKQLKNKLQQSLENPKVFYDEKNEFILSERGLTYPKDKSLTSKFVLVDTLIDLKQMTEVDWKEEEYEVRLWINEIAQSKGYNFVISTNIKYGNDTLEVIQSISSKELNPLDYCIEILDINSDSYVFTIIPLEKQQEVENMFVLLQ